MKKKLSILAVVGLMACLIGSIAIAGGPNPQSVKSKPGELYLYQKELPPTVPDWPFSGDLCLDDHTWNDLTRGGWGKMKYNSSGQTFDYNFEGHGLESGESYTLIYFPDNVEYGYCRPGNGLIFLGSDVAKGNGNVNIKGSLATGDLPAYFDGNSGAKIWLVLSADIYIPYPQFLYPWHPKGYLFEEKGQLITFDMDTF